MGTSLLLIMIFLRKANQTIIRYQSITNLTTTRGFFNEIGEVILTSILRVEREKGQNQRYWSWE